MERRAGHLARAALGRARRAVAARPRGRAPQAFPPGHAYSPIVDAATILGPPDVDRVWPADVVDPPGIDFRGADQLALLEALAAYAMPSTDDGLAMVHDPANDQFPPHDVAVLYAMIRHLRPARVVEVGSGWSTTVTSRAIRDGGLDTHLTAIEPHPRDFLGSLDPLHELRVERVEHTPSSVFEALGVGDVLFVDSSHVAKTGSDVVHLLLDVVPRLPAGVVVHVHDVFLPEDYPQTWVRAGFGWNEQYLVHALLLGGGPLHPLLLNRWLARRHPDAVTAAFGPLALEGSSAWCTVAVP